MAARFGHKLIALGRPGPNRIDKESSVFRQNPLLTVYELSKNSEREDENPAGSGAGDRCNAVGRADLMAAGPA